MAIRREYIYFGVIAIIAVYLISKLRSPAPGVVSSLVPVSVGGTGTSTTTTDPGKVQAFTALASLAQGQQQAATRSAELQAGLQAETIRAQTQSAALGVQRELGLASLETSLQQKAMDNQTRLDALAYMGSQSNQAAMTSGIFASIAAALRALGGSQASQGRAGQAGGGSTQPGAIQRAIQRIFPSIPTPNIGPATPPFNPGYLTPNVGDPFQSGDFGSSPYVTLPIGFPLDLGGMQLNTPLPPGQPAEPVLGPDFQEVPNGGGGGAIGSMDIGGGAESGFDFNY